MRESLPAGARIGVVLAGAPVTGESLAAVAERYAAHGYAVALAAVDAAGGIDAALASVDDAMRALRAGPAPAAQIAVAGYGFAGAAGFLAVTRLGAAAAVAFCGAGIAAYLSEARGLTAPLGLHFADDDPAVPIADVRAIKGALEGFATVEIYRYPTFDAAAAERAERRAFALLDTLVASLG